MTDVQIRAYIDSLAEPLSLDEVIDAGVVARVVPMRSARRPRPWTLAAALIAVLGLAGLAVVASRDSSAPSAGLQAVGLELTPSDPEAGTSFVATLTGESLDGMVVRREAYIEQLVGDAWQRIWLVYPVFTDATALPPEPIELTGGNVPPGGSPIQLVATRPFRVTLPRQLGAGSYRFCLQAYGPRSTAADGDTCAPMVVRDPASTVTSVPPIASTPSGIGSPPKGTEEPLVEVAITGVQSVAKPDSVNAFSVQGHPDLLVWTTLMLNPQTGDVEEWRCVSEAGGSGCGPVSIPAQFGQTSSIDNQVASDDLFTWINLPSDVTIVTYDDGVKQLWQRAVSGSAIFRVDPDHPHPTIRAYDAYDAALPYSFWSQNPPLPQPTDATDVATTAQSATPAASGQGFGELETLTQSAMYDCLSSHGATWPMQNVPSFGVGSDPVTIWNSCVEHVRSIVATREATLHQGP